MTVTDMSSIVLTANKRQRGKPMYPEYCEGCYKLEGSGCVYPDPAAKIGLKADGSVSLGCGFNPPKVEVKVVKINPLKKSKRSKR